MCVRLSNKEVYVTLPFSGVDTRQRGYAACVMPWKHNKRATFTSTRRSGAPALHPLFHYFAFAVSVTVAPEKVRVIMPFWFRGVCLMRSWHPSNWFFTLPFVIIFISLFLVLLFFTFNIFFLLLLLILFCVFSLKPSLLHFIYFGELITTQEIMRVPHNGCPCTRPHFCPFVLKAIHCCYLGLICCFAMQFV